ncbi:MAG: hypothetical protein ACREGC_03035, partial [Minisyncoccia bacterium]
ISMDRLLPILMPILIVIFLFFGALNWLGTQADASMATRDIAFFADANGSAVAGYYETRFLKSKNSLQDIDRSVRFFNDEFQCQLANNDKSCDTPMYVPGR